MLESHQPFLKRLSPAERKEILYKAVAAAERGDDDELGFDNCTQVPALAEALRKRGYTPDQIEKIAFRNMRRILTEII